jgi:hypothetical protein
VGPAVIEQQQQEVMSLLDVEGSACGLDVGQLWGKLVRATGKASEVRSLTSSRHPSVLLPFQYCKELLCFVTGSCAVTSSALQGAGHSLWQRRAVHGGFSAQCGMRV